MKDEFLCGLALYIFVNRALLPSVYKSERGSRCDDEPVTEFDYRSRDELLKALEHAGATGNPSKSLTPEEEKDLCTIERHANVRSWAEVESKSVYFSIECWTTFYEVKSWKKSSSGRWLDEKEGVALKVEVPAEQGMTAVADLIIDHLKSRKDLPSLAIK